MSEAQVFMPSTDILECEDGFHIYMDIPGVDPEGVSIDLEQNELTVKGTSNYKPGKNQGMREEFGPVCYERVFTLSDMVDKEKVKATVKNGVLDLFLPKAESMKPRRIQIRSV